MILTLVKLTKKDSNDNLVSDCLYTFNVDKYPTEGNILWGWVGDTGYHTERILKIKDNYLISYNAKYTWDIIEEDTDKNNS